ncbi:MAG: cytosine permease [Ewingella americana]|jgi:purine-cytosine permease-like protein|uniref:purine-cytosine permease family protein n=1 Tax=Ewingella americana TaxID=41202 RepID=UPI00242D426E|nr:cytosine permease [Ewingella americana]MCI1680707.1 cytosine permease [Ewingella americana]MCI1853179.1 cytosine permease [Ewingella americana]MCI1860580.1 cytosine permease [Ewingella americana]MCI2164640.1 cytosine permease [Ewingella americana]MCI2210543.1 cytosine permease [Ewingella americana]
MTNSTHSPAPSGLKVESNGVNAVPESERYGNPSGLFPIWFSWNVSILGIAYGVYVYSLGLSLWQAISAGIIGYLLSCILVGILAVGGPRTGLPTLTQTRFCFGYHGNKFPTLFAYISNMGWKITLITLASSTGAALFAKLWPSAFALADGKPTLLCILGWFILSLALTMSIAVYGHQLIMKVEKYIAWLTGFMSIIFIFLMLPHIHWDKLGHGAAHGDLLTYIGGVVMAMTMVGLGFLNYGGDFARYLPKKTPASKVIFWTTAGISLPVSILLILGAFLADSNPDLSAAASQAPIASLTNLLPFWFYVPFSIVIIISLLAAAITGVYSSGLALLALGIPASRATTTMLNAIIIGFGAFYLMFISDSFLSTFQSFLASISVVMGSAGAIELIDFLRQKRLGWDITMANKAGFGGRNGRWTALVALFTATLVGLGTITSGDPYIAHIVGFLLTDETRHSVFATANIGVIVSMLVGGGIYALLTFVLNIALPGITSQPTSTAKAQPLKPQRTL